VGFAFYWFAMFSFLRLARSTTKARWRVLLTSIHHLWISINYVITNKSYMPAWV
jgi:hypothetical protein